MPHFCEMDALVLTVWLPLGDKGIHKQYSASSSHPFLLLTASHRPQWLKGNKGTININKGK